MRTLTTLGCCLALAAPVIAGGDEERNGVVHTTLTSLRNSPESYRMLKVSFTVQFAGVGQIQNPFFTRFVSTDYTSFYGWSDDQEIWRRFWRSSNLASRRCS